MHALGDESKLFGSEDADPYDQGSAEPVLVGSRATHSWATLVLAHSPT
jgi:hypothetical protein